MIAVAITMLLALIAVVAQHLYWQPRHATAVAAARAIAAESRHASVDVGLWRASYRGAYRELLDEQGRRRSAEARADRLAEDLHWSRLSAVVLMAGADFRGDVLGAGGRQLDQPVHPSRRRLRSVSSEPVLRSGGEWLR